MEGFSLFDFAAVGTATGEPCFHCGRPTNLVLIISDGRDVTRKPCCFNIERGCDSAANANL